MQKFELSAHAEDNPNTPENGFGQFKVETGTLSITVDVRCVNPVMVGLRPSARITGVATRSSNPAFVGESFGVDVSDGGEPSAAPVDTWYFFHTVLPAETGCFTFPPSDGPPNVEQGNIVVKF